MVLSFFLCVSHVLALLERNNVTDQLFMDGIGVSPRMRGSVIGTRLLHNLIEYAQKDGYQPVRLDVIGKNPAAWRLYGRVGVTSVKTEQFVYLKLLPGFEVAT